VQRVGEISSLDETFAFLMPVVRKEGRTEATDHIFGVQSNVHYGGELWTGKWFKKVHAWEGSMHLLLSHYFDSKFNDISGFGLKSCDVAVECALVPSTFCLETLTGEYKLDKNELERALGFKKPKQPDSWRSTFLKIYNATSHTHIPKNEDGTA
jgi:hypothetical protein